MQQNNDRNYVALIIVIDQSMSLIQTTRIYRKKHRTQTQEQVTHMTESAQKRQTEKHFYNTTLISNKRSK